MAPIDGLSIGNRMATRVCRMCRNGLCKNIAPDLGGRQSLKTSLLLLFLDSSATSLVCGVVRNSAYILVVLLLVIIILSSIHRNAAAADAGVIDRLQQQPVAMDSGEHGHHHDRENREQSCDGGQRVPHKQGKGNQERSLGHGFERNVREQGQNGRQDQVVAAATRRGGGSGHWNMTFVSLHVYLYRMMMLPVCGFVLPRRCCRRTLDPLVHSCSFLECRVREIRCSKPSDKTFHIPGTRFSLVLHQSPRGRIFDS